MSVWGQTLDLSLNTIAAIIYGHLVDNLWLDSSGSPGPSVSTSSAGSSHGTLSNQNGQRWKMEEYDHDIAGLSFWFHSKKLPGCLSKAWLSQAAHVFSVLGVPREEWEGYALLEGNVTSFTLVPDIDDTQPIFHHPRCVDTQFDPSCYLFVLPPPQLPDTTPNVATWLRAPAESLYYWSLDPTGDSKMPETQQIALGLPSFHQSYNPSNHMSWKAEVYDLAQRWQETQGFDPTTTDFARSMGHPLLEIFPRDGNRIEDCMADDEDSRHEPELERMEVDECFETDPTASQGTLFPQERFGESSSMDIDMEDCSDLIADLRIEATLMDE
ncbi:hypothetical protein AAF712_016010 [Marasmius tenuissimus]|uniref:Uncharacterized protein n=1 Tax=Marasmius tenuissimus TaxID=585030 RepID=A0ABR2Z8M9_9AGAR